MRYFVTLEPSPEAKPIVVDLVELPSGALKAKADGTSVDLDVVVIGTQLNVRVDGRVVDLTVEGTPPEIGASASGHRALVRVESERMRAADSAKKGSAGSGERGVKSPMPGRVVKVLVAKGDSVPPGQDLPSLEPIKIENKTTPNPPPTLAQST